MSVDDPRIVDLDVLLETVHDESTFIDFVDALAADFALEKELEDGKPVPYSAGLLGWENGTIDNFLGASARWGETGVFADKQNPWRRCAHILYAGKWYE
ncbi:DUF7660 family protein [Sphingomonas alpina]|uniref:DUF7660 domain-containing protein n=1 Tax=Sphingomonas alpina TaxID=653931 RepID=A0A7H0LMX6_9SPHN|nr:hypothetical protein [Sphingomonas alpina]QNQ11029.1 hypothetical protein H3Z74_07660 [Sphingomonas alpina]